MTKAKVSQRRDLRKLETRRGVDLRCRSRKGLPLLHNELVLGPTFFAAQKKIFPLTVLHDIVPSILGLKKLHFQGSHVRQMS